MTPWPMPSAHWLKGPHFIKCLICLRTHLIQGTFRAGGKLRNKQHNGKESSETIKEETDDNNCQQISSVVIKLYGDP